jgi:hypothetical protein
MKNVVFWDVTLCDSSENRRFRRIYRLHHQGEKNQRIRYNVSTNAVPNWLIRFNMMIESKDSSETLVLTKVTWRQISEDDSLPASHVQFATKVIFIAFLYIQPPKRCHGIVLNYISTTETLLSDIVCSKFHNFSKCYLMIFVERRKI